MPGLVIGYNTDKISASIEEGKWTIPINIVSKEVFSVVC